jgi:hypothetical protein
MQTCATKALLHIRRSKLWTMMKTNEKEAEVEVHPHQ